MIEDTFTNRLNKIMKIRKMRQTDLVRKTKEVMNQYIENYNGNGIDKTLLSKYMNGTAKAGNDNLFILAAALDVSEAWLLGYNVPMEQKYHSSINKLPTEYNEEDDIKILNELFQRKGIIGKDQKINMDDYNNFIAFVNANKNFIIKKND